MTSSGDPIEEIDISAPRPRAGEVLVRVESAGICHSDVHYRSGLRSLDSLPIVLGHETAGTVEAVGHGADPALVGTRVALHYVLSCEACMGCTERGEQFCEHYQMLGVSRQGGFAEFITVPARNAVPIPDSISTDHAAVMMCSSATALHALRRGGVEPDCTVAVFGAGGLGMSAVQLARALGATPVYVVDLDPIRLSTAATLGATPLVADQAAEVLADHQPDVTLDLVGSFEVLRQAIDVAPPGGRVVAVGLTEGELPIDPYVDLISREVALIGSNDHLLTEIHELFTIAAAGGLTLEPVVTDHIPLNAGAVNDTMDVMERYGPGVRTVIEPTASSR